MSAAPIEDGLAFVRQAREDLAEDGLPLNEWTASAYLLGYLAGRWREQVEQLIGETYEDPRP